MNFPNSKPHRAPPGSRNGLQRIVHLVLRLAAGLMALALMLGALMLGLLLALGMVTWALLRGRKPAVGVFRSSYRRARNTSSTGAAPEIVDIEAREIREVPESGLR